MQWVVIPVVCGFMLGRLLPQFEKQAKSIGAIIANLSILVIIATVVGTSRDNLGQLESNLLVAVAD